MVDNKENIVLALSLNSIDEVTMSNIQKEFLEDEIKDIEPIKEHDINIYTSYVFDMGEEIEVKVFFRNGFSSSINFEMMPLLLLDEAGEVVAEQSFNLRDLEEIPSHSIRPYKLFFNKSNINVCKNIGKGWKVAFNSDIKVVKTVNVEYENMPENLEIDAKIFFNKYLLSLPLIEKEQIEIRRYMVILQEENKIKLTILIRNGLNKKIKVEKIPLTIFDANEKEICSIILGVEDLEVNPLKAQLCNFLVDLSDKDLSEFNMENLSLEFK